MPQIRELIAYADDLLDASAFADYGPNGLQVPGPDAVEHVVTGVSATAALFERAAALHADLVLTHHGLFWGEPAGPISPALKRRLQLLFDHDMALAAYHLPLDAHPAAGQQRAAGHRSGRARRRAVRRASRPGDRRDRHRSTHPVRATS